MEFISYGEFQGTSTLAKHSSEFGVHYEWFKEEKGQKHWVLYNTENYEIKYEDEAYLVAKHAFEFCVNLPNFDCENVDANSTTLILKENGGYLTNHLGYAERMLHNEYLSMLSEINNGTSISERIKNFINNYSYEVSENGLSLIPEDEADLKKRFGKYLREDVKYKEKL